MDAIKLIRDDVEHGLLGRSDVKWLSLFQACCLNFETMIRKLFGDALSLQRELSYALQFARLNMDQISELQKHEIPERIEALDARINEGLTADQLGDLEYQFRVIFTLDHASKSRSHIQFVHPETDEGKEIRNILVKHKLSDELYPHKPGKVAPLVAERSGKRFTQANHTQAWRKYSVRPRANSRTPSDTNKDYCVYHTAHGDYTYSEKWVDHLVKEIASEEGHAAICNYKL